MLFKGYISSYWFLVKVIKQLLPGRREGFDEVIELGYNNGF